MCNMSRNKQYGKVFHTQIAEDTFQLSTTLDGYGSKPGKACRNSYLIIGSEKAVLFDLALEEPELVLYAEHLAGKRTEIVLSHAHVDHIFNAEKVSDLWLHKEDEKLLRHGAIFQKALKPCPTLHFLKDKEKIDLGDRTLSVIHIPGHTDGSILLYDEKHSLLFSGDTVTRRLLYGMHRVVPLAEFCENLEKLNEFKINGIYSAHDRVCLPSEHIDYMTDMLCNYLPKNGKIKRMLFAKFLTFTDGEETDLKYFDFAQLIKKRNRK